MALTDLLQTIVRLIMIREAIKNRLAELGITQKKCAVDNGLEIKNFNSFLLGRRAFPLSDIEKVFKYLDLEIVGKPEAIISQTKKGINKVDFEPVCGDEFYINYRNSDAKCHRKKLSYAIAIVKNESSICVGCVYNI